MARNFFPHSTWPIALQILNHFSPSLDFMTQAKDLDVKPLFQKDHIDTLE